MRAPAICLALLPLAAVADDRQFGDIVYTPPAGWGEGLTSDGVRTLLSNLPDDRCEFCYIYLGPSRKGAGNVVTFLRSEHLRFVDEEDRGETEVVAEAEPTTIAGHDAAMMALNADGAVQIVVAIKLDGRFQLLGFQGSGYDEAEVAETLAVFEEQVAPFFDSLRFVSAGAAALLPEPEPGELSGLWWGWKTEWVMQIDLTMQMEVAQRRLVFWEDGYFYDGLPPEGLRPLDPDRLVAAGNTDFGVYELAGGELRLTFADGRTETLPADGMTFSEGDRELSRVETLADGETIAGTISTFNYTGFTPGSGLQGGVAGGSETVFKADGTYEGSSFGGAFANFEGTGGESTGGFTTSSENATGGRYEIRDGLLIQYPTDGSPPTQSLIYRTDNGISIDDLFLDEGG